MKKTNFILVCITAFFCITVTHANNRTEELDRWVRHLMSLGYPQSKAIEHAKNWTQPSRERNLRLQNYLRQYLVLAEKPFTEGGLASPHAFQEASHFMDELVLTTDLSTGAMSHFSMVTEKGRTWILTDNAIAWTTPKNSLFELYQSMPLLSKLNRYELPLVLDRLGFSKNEGSILPEQIITDIQARKNIQPLAAQWLKANNNFANNEMIQEKLLEIGIELKNLNLESLNENLKKVRGYTLYSPTELRILEDWLKNANASTVSLFIQNFSEFKLPEDIRKSFLNSVLLNSLPELKESDWKKVVEYLEPNAEDSIRTFFRKEIDNHIPTEKLKALLPTLSNENMAFEFERIFDHPKVALQTKAVVLNEAMSRPPTPELQNAITSRVRALSPFQAEIFLTQGFGPKRGNIPMEYFQALLEVNNAEVTHFLSLTRLHSLEGPGQYNLLMKAFQQLKNTRYFDLFLSTQFAGNLQDERLKAAKDIAAQLDFKNLPKLQKALKGKNSETLALLQEIQSKLNPLSSNQCLVDQLNRLYFN